MNLPDCPLSLTLPHGRKLKCGRAFRARKKRQVAWRNATPQERDWLKGQPELEPLGDFLLLAPSVEDELWLLIERIWNGWPDPPMYAFLAYDQDYRLILGKDFDVLPRTWTLP